MPTTEPTPTLIEDLIGAAAGFDVVAKAALSNMQRSEAEEATALASRLRDAAQRLREAIAQVESRPDWWRSFAYSVLEKEDVARMACPGRGYSFQDIRKRALEGLDRQPARSEATEEPKKSPPPPTPDGTP